jgi:hypothetical protein
MSKTVTNWKLYYVEKKNQENTSWEKPKDYTTQNYDIYWTDDNNPNSEQIKHIDALGSKDTELAKAANAISRSPPRKTYSEQIKHTESSDAFPGWTLTLVGDFNIPLENPVDCKFETVCPITFEKLDKFTTVKLSDGHCYRTSGLQRYKGLTSPLTRADLSPEDLEIIKKIKTQTAYYIYENGTTKLSPKQIVQRFPAFPRYMGYDQLLKLGESGYVWNLKDDQLEQAPDFFSNPPNYSAFTMDDGTQVTAINKDEYTSGWKIGDRQSVWKKTYFKNGSPTEYCGDPTNGETCDALKWRNEGMLEYQFDADSTGQNIISSQPIIDPLAKFMETNKIKTELDCIQYLREFPNFRLFFPPVIIVPLLSDIGTEIQRLNQQNNNNPDLVKQCLKEDNVSSCMTCKKMKKDCPTSLPPVLASKLQEYQRAVGVYEKIQEIKGSLAAGPRKRDPNEKNKKYDANGFTEEEQNQRDDLQIELNTLEHEICSGEKNGHPMPKFCPTPQSGGKKSTRRKQRKSTRRKSKRRPNKTRR